jgi:hypothetical protein
MKASKPMQMRFQKFAIGCSRVEERAKVLLNG